MFRFGKYLCIELKEEFTQSPIFGAYIYETADELTFPCFFERSDSYDLHFCDVWVPSDCSKAMYEAIGKEIDELIDIQTQILKCERITNVRTIRPSEEGSSEHS